MGAHTSSSTFLQRIERLEQDNRRLRLAVSALLGTLFLGLLTAQARPKSRTVEAERFVITDGKGGVRGQFGTDSLGMPSLDLGWGNGAAGGAVGFAVHSDGGATFALISGRRGRPGPSALLTLDSAGYPSLTFRDDQGRLRAGLSFSADSSGSGSTLLLVSRPDSSISSVSAHAWESAKGAATSSIDVSARAPGGARGRFGVGLEAGRDGRPSVTVYDTSGLTLLPRARLGLDTQGAASLSLYPKLSELANYAWPRAELKVTGDGSPSVSLYDDSVRARAVLGPTQLEMERTGGVERRPVGSLVLFAKDGRVLWKAP
jgi:hypothetical protein